MSETAIRIERLGKQYRIGTRERYRTLRDSLSDAIAAPWRRLRARSSHGPDVEASDLFWALRDVSFEIPRGAVVGVIGRNGAGKSTLLKVLSRITEPTEGRVEIHGRVGSLLEVGTGFHPELTGRENIFLNGAILGMRKSDIVSKFDEIVAFAEVDRFIDTPVKHYSSGMYMRLAFAVAAHLEPDILLVDEVLAVGDAQFQKKCLGKMGQVAKAGRTVVFVSHNMAAVENLCTRCVLLVHGSVDAIGDSSSILGRYFSSTNPTDDADSVDLKQHAGRSSWSVPVMTAVTIAGVDASRPSGVRTNDGLVIAVDFESPQPLQPVLGVVIKTATGVPVTAINNRITGARLQTESVAAGTMRVAYPRLPLLPGTYLIDLYFGDYYRDVDVVTEAASFEIVASDVYGSGQLLPTAVGPVYCPATFELRSPPSALAGCSASDGPLELASNSTRSRSERTAAVR